MSMVEERYKAAIDTHKLYDTVSMSIVGGMFAVAGASFLISEKVGSKNLVAIVFFTTALLLIPLLIIYRKSACYANTARNVASGIEMKECDLGVSQVLADLEKYPKYKAEKHFYKGIYGAVHWIWFILSVALVSASVFNFISCSDQLKSVNITKQQKIEQICPKIPLLKTNEK